MNGFLNVLKPPGMTSARVVAFARHLLDGEKVGHAGTLDPEACGVLPLMTGKAARLFDYMQDKQKEYIAEVAFGCSTTTQDAQGEVVERSERYPSEASLRTVLPRFTGQLLQRPPMYSALKQNGKRLYDLAREGQSAEIPPRAVTVYELELTRMTQPHAALLRVVCSKGFYVRTLCHDLGLALDCPAHMRFLLRTQTGPFGLPTAKTLEELTQAKNDGTLQSMLLPMETALGHLPTFEVSPKLEKPFRNGIALDAKRAWPLETLPEGTPFRMTIRGTLAAIGECENGQVRQRTWLLDTGED